MVYNILVLLFVCDFSSLVLMFVVLLSTDLNIAGTVKHWFCDLSVWYNLWECNPHHIINEENASTNDYIAWKVWAAMKTFRLKVQERANYTVHHAQCFVTVQPHRKCFPSGIWHWFGIYRTYHSSGPKPTTSYEMPLQNVWSVTTVAFLHENLHLKI